MSKTVFAVVSLLALVLTVSCGGGGQEDVSAQIIGMERAALDRWNKGDPQGYLEIFAPEMTYFDPTTEQRVDGFAAMKALLEPITGKIKGAYEMVNPKVQQHGEVALLTFNLVSKGTGPDGAPVTVRWNSTEVYSRINGEWRIIHSHWSFIKPQLKP